MEASAQVPEAILKLVERYEFHQVMYKKGEYNETRLRREFLDPFFKTLGWDVDNTKGYSELYKEVTHEDPIRIRGSTEFIDYSFRIGGSRKFIVEAKKPAVNIKDDAGPALQIRRYAWNAHLPLSILTDFEEFAVYDCTKKPMPGDNAATARVAYFTYKEYPEKWNWIANIFSQESILQGSFDRFATETKGKKGTATVDEAILADIEEWRDVLAKNIALRNAILSVDELNVAVQKTIDRILFLRICEDRGIEEYGCLQKLLEGQDVYQRLLSQFHRADTRYNSGLFHFNPEVGWDEMPDTLTTGLVIDDVILKKIIKRLYYPESPYEFSVISPVILGQVYEQFLGKVIRLTAGHQAKVEYKPEVKKAGGVYYTPQYIVDYIVNHTVGELVKDKTPRDVAKIRVLDPACGSGSFLLGAYQFLLDWHLTWYIHNLVPVIADKSMTSPEVQALLPEPIPKEGKKKSSVDTSLPIYKSANGSTSRVRSDWKLTIAERKRILLNNIYGVDIDTQAVEVTKLSLLLKVLEDESQENVSKQLKLFDERALPSLHQNVKCGNSLIGTDIYTEMPTILEDPEMARRINAFDWDREFPEITQRGGFDAVIGNPPYLRQEALKEWKEYYIKHYQVYQSTADLYTYFIEKGISLLKEKGLFSYIVANKWIKASYGKPLRKFLISKQIEELIDFEDLPVFKTATTYPCIIRISNKKPIHGFLSSKIDSLNFPNLDNYLNKRRFSVEYSDISEDIWTLEDKHTSDLIKKLRYIGCPLEEYVNGKIFRGITSGLNKAFLIDDETRIKLISEDQKCQGWIRPFIVGRDIKRYNPVSNVRYILFIPWHFPLHDDISITGASKKAEIAFKEEFPSIYSHLTKFKNELLNRNSAETEIRYEWYALQRYGSSYYHEFAEDKIIFPEMAVRGQFTIDKKKSFSDSTTYIISNSSNYLLGLLNSKIITFFFSKISSQIQGGYYRWKHQYISQIPIRTINFSDLNDKTRHDTIVALVERMLSLNNQRIEMKTEHEQNLINRQIEAIDRQIDTLVYQLYGLTEEEIQIVEGHFNENI